MGECETDVLGGLWCQRCGESEFWSFCERESVEDFGSGDDKEGRGGCISAVAAEELGGFGACLYRLVLQGLPKSLIFLSVDNDTSCFRTRWIQENLQFWGPLFKRWEVWSKSSQWIGQIGCLEELQFIRLEGFEGGKLPDMRSMVSLRKVMFRWCQNVVSVTGLSSELTNLRVLELQKCRELRTCHGVGDLVALEELDLGGCGKLKGLPNLQVT